MKDCLFCKIISNELEVTKIFETEDFIAFNDINPLSPVHILCIPKKHISSVSDLNEKDTLLTGKLLLFAKEVASKQTKNGFRFIINTGEDAGQTVGHLHLHILGGKTLNWSA